MYGEAKTETATKGDWMPVGSGIEVNHETARVRVDDDVVCPTRLDLLPHLTLVTAVERSGDDPRSDLIVHAQCSLEDGKVYVDSLPPRRATLEPIEKPVGFCLETEIAAEVEMARQIVDPLQMRRAGL